MHGTERADVGVKDACRFCPHGTICGELAENGWRAKLTANSRLRHPISILSGDVPKPVRDAPWGLGLESCLEATPAGKR